MRLHGDDLPFLRPDLLEQREQQFAPLGRLGLELPEALEVAEQRLRALDAGVGRRAESLRLLLDRLAAHHVLRSRQVAEHVEVLQPCELAEQLAAPGLGRVDGGAVGFDRLDDQRDQPLVGLEVADPLNELTLQALGVDDPLATGVAGAPRRAHVATGGFAAAARGVHARAAALAAQQFRQQVFARRRTGLQHAIAPAANLLHALVQLLGDDRLVQPFDRAAAVALAADVAAVGGVAEHFANAVFAERTIARRARTDRVQPPRDRHVRFLAADVALEGFEHERRSLRVGDRKLAARVAHVAERKLTYEVALARLLLQAAAHPEGERDGVVLVEHLLDRLGEERGRVGVVFAHRLRDRDEADAELLAQHLLVATRLDLVAREARGVKDEHDVELAGGGVGHQALELRPRGGLAPAGVEVAVLADQLQVVLGRELADALALCVGREAFALLLGRLADVGDRAKRRVRHRLGRRR